MQHRRQLRKWHENDDQWRNERHYVRRDRVARLVDVDVEDDDVVDEQQRHENRLRCVPHQYIIVFNRLCIFRFIHDWHINLVSPHRDRITFFHRQWNHPIVMHRLHSLRQHRLRLDRRLYIVLKFVGDTRDLTMSKCVCYCCKTMVSINIFSALLSHAMHFDSIDLCVVQQHHSHRSHHHHISSMFLLLNSILWKRFFAGMMQRQLPLTLRRPAVICSIRLLKVNDRH